MLGVPSYMLSVTMSVDTPAAGRRWWLTEGPSRMMWRQRRSGLVAFGVGGVRERRSQVERQKMPCFAPVSWILVTDPPRRRR